MQFRKPRPGVVLFVIYLLFYGAFVAINAYRPEMMELRMPGGLNLAVVYGFALIIVALLLSLIYGWMSRGGGAQ